MQTQLQRRQTWSSCRSKGRLKRCAFEETQTPALTSCCWHLVCAVVSQLHAPLILSTAAWYYGCRVLSTYKV